MFPVLPKAEKYSYSSFSIKDLFINRYYYNYHLDDCDCIDFTAKTPEETLNWFKENFVRYEEDVNSDTSHYKFYFLRNFIFKEKFHCMEPNEKDYQYHLFDYLDKDSNFIWEFNISSWDDTFKSKGIDNRTLKVTIYRDTGAVYLSYLVKLDHIYQCILDLDRIIDALEANTLSANDVNYKVLPIFMVYMPGRASGPCNHVRISKMLTKQISGETKGRILYYILHGLIRFSVLNYKMIIATEKNSKSKESKPKAKRESSNSTTPRKRVKVELEVPVNQESKNNIVSIFLDEKEEISVKINTERPNVYYSRKDDILVNVIKYRTQVHGFWNYYWCGKGENKVKEARWIEPYIRNVTSNNRSKKVYKEASNERDYHSEN